MSDSESLLTTIDDYLLSIAEGLHEAQQQLDKPDATGSTAAYRYYLPKLDFELKMTIEMQERSVTGGPAQRVLLLRPAPVNESSSSSIAISTVSGSFVAVPNSAARKALHATSAIVWSSSRVGTVSVELRDGTGAPQAGEEVHFNVDRELSAAANRELGLSSQLAAATAFDDAVVVTNEQGKASSTLRVADSEGTQIVIVLDAAGQTETIQHAVTGSASWEPA